MLKTNAQHDLAPYPELLYGSLEFSSDGVYISGPDGTTLYVNPAYEEITGLKRADLMGRKLSELRSENVFNESASLKALEMNQPVSLIHHYSSGRTALTTATPILHEDGTVCGVVCNTRNIDELTELNRELEHVNLIRQQYSQELELLRREHYSSKGLIHKSRAMELTLKKASTAAGFDSTILISGESGTGKELVAKFIYQNSQRSDKPFIRVNCAAIPKDLFESELFGYMPGSFTGAARSGKAGLFELANSGTILLDEIGELTMPIQSKLLRVLQEREVYRVGGTKPIELDVRVIASTNRDLPEEIKQGNFREDLYFRLNVVPIHIAPLRDRPDDIPELINHFMKQLNSKYNKLVMLSPEASDALCRYSWPGNVRELQNIMEYMFIMNEHDEIRFEQLPDKILNEHVLMDDIEQPEFGSNRLEYLMGVYEKIILESALKKHRSLRPAAKALGIDASTLSRKVAKYSIEY